MKINEAFVLLFCSTFGGSQQQVSSVNQRWISGGRKTSFYFEKTKQKQTDSFRRRQGTMAPSPVQKVDDAAAVASPSSNSLAGRSLSCSDQTDHTAAFTSKLAVLTNKSAISQNAF